MRLISLFFFFLVQVSVFGDTTASQPNSIELSGGVNTNQSRGRGFLMGQEKKFFPMIGILYQREVADSFHLGVSLRSILISTEVKSGSFVSLYNSKTKIAPTPLDLTGTYYFMSDSSFQPFLRGYVGVARILVKGPGIKYDKNLYHLGLGGGFRYFFSESFYGLTEIGINRFQNSDVKQNSFYGNLGLGLTF